jgi:hypothetical protein
MTIEELNAELAALPAAGLVPNEEARQRRHGLMLRLNAARDATRTLVQLDADIATWSTWRDHLTNWREALCDQFLACPGPSRDRAAMDRYMGLKLSIGAIDHNLDWQHAALPSCMPLFDLMTASGYRAQFDELGNFTDWLGCLPYAEQRLADLHRRRDAAQRALDDALREPMNALT